MAAPVPLAPSPETTHHPLMIELARAKAALWLLDELHNGAFWDVGKNERFKVLAVGLRDDLEIPASELRGWIETMCEQPLAYFSLARALWIPAVYAEEAKTGELRRVEGPEGLADYGGAVEAARVLARPCDRGERQ